MLKRIFLTAAFCLFLNGTALVSFAGNLSPEFRDILLSLHPDTERSVIISLADRAKIHLLQEENKPLLRSKIVKALKEKADLSQASLKALLESRGGQKIIPLWLINGIAVRAKAGLLLEMEDQPGIESIRPDETLNGPVVSYGAPVPQEWNIHAVRAPDVWKIGHTGRGTVIATMDTGVDPGHPDLLGKWRGGLNSWFDPHGEHGSPYDAHGHGTQLMGVLVGGNQGGTAIGVAPDATWISVKIYNDAHQTTLSVIHQGFQWLLDPDHVPDTDDAPHVVNISWGLDNANLCSTEFQTDIQVLKTSHIALALSAGNSGPDPFTSISPGNDPEGFAVGATDASRTIGLSSSRGPSACDGRIYPDLVAPGINIRTTDLTFGGVVPDSYVTVSGTSFSAPHVAGAMALLRGALPGLTVPQLESVLSETALDLGATGPDNDYGHGLLDAYGAYLGAFQVLYGQGITDLLSQYYRGALERDPDPPGFSGWTGEALRMASLGIDLKESFRGIARYFFQSDEYLQRARTDQEYISDLYKACFNRIPESWELSWWLTFMTSGGSRNLVLNSFLYSEEFDLQASMRFGTGKGRPENQLISYFYRGFLSRSPESDGFDYWVHSIRDTQCLNPNGLGDLIHVLASEFIHSPEYQGRDRNHRDFVEDLYDGLLQRGADPVLEIGFWEDLLQDQTYTRDEVLRFFTDSDEFQIRIQGLIQAGCLPWGGCPVS